MGVASPKNRWDRGRLARRIQAVLPADEDVRVPSGEVTICCGYSAFIPEFLTTTAQRSISLLINA